MANLSEGIGRLNFNVVRSPFAKVMAVKIMARREPVVDTEIRSVFVDLGELRLHCRMTGQGPAVVLLHGWPQTSRAWRRVMTELAADHLVIAPDLRGFGQSSCPPTGYDKRTLAGDLQRLLDHLSIQPMAVIGHDWGSLVAYSLAHDAPRLVPRLVMIEIGVLDDRFWELPLRIVANAIWHMPFHRVPGLPETLVTGRVREYLGWFYATAHNRAGFAQDDIDEYIRCYEQPERLHAGFELYRAIDRDIDDQRARTGATLKMPVLAIGGEFSQGAAIGQSLAGIAENLRPEVVADAAHWIPDEQPEALVRLLRDFFAETGGHPSRG
ncbi:MAG: alpha/beta hydrolase [Devosia sp.]|nr:alpha/beta hydrolase [Devosia sp.]